MHANRLKNQKKLKVCTYWESNLLILCFFISPLLGKKKGEKNENEPVAKSTRLDEGTKSLNHDTDLFSATNYFTTLNDDEKLLAESDREKGLMEFTEAELYLKTRALQRHYLNETVEVQIDKFPWLQNVSTVST